MKIHIQSKLKDSTITIETDFSEFLDGVTGTLIRQVADTQERMVRERLIELGWTPPENNWVPRAAKRVLEYAGYASWLGPAGTNGCLGSAHVYEMLWKLVRGEVTGRKAHRWLGWAQAAVVAAGISSLELMKSINKASSEEA